MISDPVPSVAIAADAGTLSFVDRSRQLEHRSAWVTSLFAAARLARNAEVEAGGFVSGPVSHNLYVPAGVFVGGRIGEFVGPVRPVFGLRAGLAAVTERGEEITQSSWFLTIAPSVGVDIPVTRHFAIGSTFAYSYGIDLRKPELGPDHQEPRSGFDRTWITLSANVRYRF
ncbi:MAG: hypothetical protein ACXVCJ_27820 [Polyangiales bacterium]